MSRKEFNPEIDNAWTCADGVTHQLVYQGKRAQIYVCMRCGIAIKKPDLQKETQ